VPLPRSRVRFPIPPVVHPVRAIVLRFAVAGSVVVLNWALVVVERGSYTDSHDGQVSVIDALYYTTVTLTTTGYGDITPVTDGARLVNALVVTPMRLLFVILLVGTTIQALTQRSREEFRLMRWRSRTRRHVVVVGYGTKGRNAIRALLERGHPRDQIVVVEADPSVAATAAADGHVVITGNATVPGTLTDAMVDRAATVVIALGRDDTSILVTLTVRRLAPSVTVVAAARQADHARLLQQSGATSVVVSSETAGRLLGLATTSPHSVDVVQDLLSFGHGLDLAGRDVTAAEVGRSPVALELPVVAVVRAGRTLHYDAPEANPLQRGDHILFVGSTAATDGVPSG
jgi:voltage-gated potassium channel